MVKRNDSGKRKCRRIISLILLALLSFNLSAQNRETVRDILSEGLDTTREVRPDTISQEVVQVLSYPVVLGGGQDWQLKTLNTFMFAVGTSNMYDSYLSPLEYTGFSIHLMYEALRDTKWLDGRFRKQQIVEGEFASGLNPIGSVREYWGRLRYQLGGHYLLYRSESDLKLNVGSFWDVNVGGLYNERNGNNPATARVYSNLNLSLLVSYKWRGLGLRWQVDSPFMGILLSPKYGQSYYEISLGNTVGLVNFASFHNQRALRNLITIDIPINTFLLRVGYLGDLYQSKVQSIQTHHYTHNLVIGFPIGGLKKHKEKVTNRYW